MRGRHNPRPRPSLASKAATDKSTAAEAPATRAPRAGKRGPAAPTKDAPRRRTATAEIPGRLNRSGRPVKADPAAEPRKRPARTDAAPTRAPRPAPADSRRRPPPDSKPDNRPGNRPDNRPDRSARAATQRTHQYFASCPRGLEPELVLELTDLGAADPVPASGGVAFTGDAELGWKVNLWSRLAIRVLRRLAEGRYQREEDLYQAALAVDWPALFEVTRTLAVTTVGKNSPLKSLNFVSLRVKDAVCDRFRQVMDERPSVDTRHPDVPLTLFLSTDRYTLYLDLSGEPLNRRGYRVQAAAAPLNENLAAGMLRLSGWTPDTPLYDPMMGGGTLLLEAAMIALNIAPGLARHFAFENLRDFDRVAWARLRKNAEAAALERRPLPIYGSDIDPDMIRAAGLNLKAAGLLDCVRVMEADFLNVDPPAPSGVIVSNPPYGVRLEIDDPGAFYEAVGDNLKQHFPGWTAWLLSADPELPKRIGLAASRRVPLFNGPLECRLFEYRMVAGGNRRG